MVTLISNPPFNLKWNLPPFAQLQSRFSHCTLPPESNANYAFILTALDMSDKAVFILPCTMLESQQEKEIREYLVEKNYVEAVILCPDRMFESTNIATCILVLNKKKENTYTEMIDLKEKYEIEIREQRGQYGEKAHTNRVYKKEVKVLSDETIEDVIRCINEKKSIAGYCKSVSIEQIKQNEYSLLARKYIELQDVKYVHREYSDIINDLNSITKEKNNLKITINESFAKELGLYDIFLLCKNSEKCKDEMVQNLSFLEKKIEKEKFIAMSKKAGEFKIENMSKDNVSTILLSIIQMWKQHIMYLNNVENRYLAELRDALLYDLMNGKIKLD